MRLYDFEEAIGLGPGESPRGKGTLQQRGAGAYTLCGSCNNKTGSWYGRHFVGWCFQGMELLHRTGGNPSLVYLNYVFPLAILKQIATMFFSVNSEEFRLANPDLVRFVLDRDRKYLAPSYRFFVYFNIEGRRRAIGTAGMLNLKTRKHHVMTEITYPPYGYLLVFDEDAPDARLLEITHFCRYDYGQFDVMELRLPVLPTHTSIPADYRSLDQIMRERVANTRSGAQDV